MLIIDTIRESTTRESTTRESSTRRPAALAGRAAAFAIGLIAIGLIVIGLTGATSAAAQSVSTTDVSTTDVSTTATDGVRVPGNDGVSDRLDGDRVESLPEELRDVGVDEHLGDRLPLDLKFRDHNGRNVTIGEYFQGETPVILTLNYASCPMLCSLQLDGLVDALNDVKLDLGTDYRALTVSIDPNETQVQSRKWMQKYMTAYDRQGVAGGWDFLYGKQEAITAITEAVGFRYQLIESTGEYSHAAVAMICTPDGRISRYLYGVTLDPTTVRLSLVESSEGAIGTPMDQILLFCFQYNPESGSYAAFARNLMKLGAAAMVIVVAGILFAVIRREGSSKTLVSPLGGTEALEGGSL